MNSSGKYWKAQNNFRADASRQELRKTCNKKTVGHAASARPTKLIRK